MIEFKQNYEEIEFIGKGTSGTVYLVQDKISKQYNVAKVISFQNTLDKDLQHAKKELSLLKQFSHPNIVQYINSFFDSNHMIIIMEYCEEGDLDYHIKIHREKNESFQEKVILNWFLQILLALQYLHSKHIIHRDLKTTNIFLNSNGNLKIGDFGISTVLDNSMQQAQSLVGTPYYLSPEVCESQPYSTKSDIWSFGCILYEICMLKRPFEAESLLGLIFQIVRKDIPQISGYSQELIDLNKKLLTKDQNERPSSSQLLMDPFIIEVMADFVNKQGAGYRIEKSLPIKQLQIHQNSSSKKKKKKKKIYIKSSNNDLQQNKDLQIKPEMNQIKISANEPCRQSADMINKDKKNFLQKNLVLLENKVKNKLIKNKLSVKKKTLSINGQKKKPTTNKIHLNNDSVREDSQMFDIESNYQSFKDNLIVPVHETIDDEQIDVSCDEDEDQDLSFNLTQTLDSEQFQNIHQIVNQKEICLKSGIQLVINDTDINLEQTDNSEIISKFQKRDNQKSNIIEISPSKLIVDENNFNPDVTIQSSFESQLHQKQFQRINSAKVLEKIKNSQNVSTAQSEYIETDNTNQIVLKKWGQVSSYQENEQRKSISEFENDQQQKDQQKTNNLIQNKQINQYQIDNICISNEDNIKNENQKQQQQQIINDSNNSQSNKQQIHQDVQIKIQKEIQSQLQFLLQKQKKQSFEKQINKIQEKSMEGNSYQSPNQFDNNNENDLILESCTEETSQKVKKSAEIHHFLEISQFEESLVVKKEMPNENFNLKMDEKKPKINEFQKISQDIYEDDFERGSESEEIYSDIVSEDSNENSILRLTKKLSQDEEIEEILDLYKYNISQTNRSQLIGGFAKQPKGIFANLYDIKEATLESSVTTTT